MCAVVNSYIYIMILNIFDSLDKNKLFFHSLGSSSSGNSALIWDDKTNILVDCGFNPTYMRKHLRAIDKDLTDIKAVLVTHSHADHVNAYFIREMESFGIPVYCHEEVLDPIFKRHHHFLKQLHKRVFHTFRNDEFSIGELTVKAFEVQHDSEGGCFGYAISKKTDAGVKKISIATDLAVPEPHIIDEFVDADVMMIESNHDIEMLDNSPRTVWLKHRIKTTGHLSNEECALFAVEAVKKSANRPHTIVLAHLSSQCNTHELAHSCTKDALESAGYGGIRISLTNKNNPGEVIEV